MAYRLHKGRMMAESEHNPIRDEPVKPPMLNPVVRHLLPSGDLKWIVVAPVTLSSRQRAAPGRVDAGRSPCQ